MNGLDFERPDLLGALLLLPLLAYLWGWRARSASRDIARLWRRGGGASPNLQAALLLIAAAAAIVAAARPTWGTRDVPVIRSGADVIFLLDISRSMDANDVSPTRLGAARAAIIETLDRTGGDRVGLIVFAGSPVLRFPLSTDPEAAAAVVSSIESGFSGVDAGSQVAQALDLARGSFDDESEAGRLVVLITDGENLGGDPAPAAIRLRISGASLLVLGVGTTEGSTILAPATVDGPAVLLDESGQPIVTRLDDALLRDVARAGDGRYLENNLDSLPGAVVSRLAALDAAEIARAPAEVPVQRFPIFAGIALGAAALAAFSDLLAMLFVRRRARRAAVALATGALAAFMLAACAERSYELNKEGLAAYERGDLEAAQTSFQAALAEDPGNHEIVLNLALTLHARGQYRDAALAAERAARSTERDLRLRALIAEGHHWFADGDIEQALGAYQDALLLDPDSRVARHDYEVILRTLQETTGDSDQRGGLPPEPGSTPAQPAPSATPGAGTPQPGPGEPTGTPQPSETQGPGRGASREELESELAELDQLIQSLLEDEDGLTYEETLELLERIGEYNRLSALLESLPRANDPLNR